MSPRSRSSRSLVAGGRPFQAESERRASRSSPTNSSARVSRISSSLSCSGVIFCVGIEQRFDDQPQDQPESPLTQVGRGGRGALVQQSDGVDEAVELRGTGPVGVVLGLALRFDVAPELDQGDQAIEPGDRYRRSGEMASRPTRSQMSRAVSGLPTVGVRLSRARASSSPAVSASPAPAAGSRPGSDRPGAKRSARRCRSGLISWRSSSSRSMAAMASRDSSHRGDSGPMADHKRHGPVAVVRRSQRQPAEQPARLVGGSARRGSRGSGAPGPRCMRR